MALPLTDTQIQEFQSNGAILIKNVLPSFLLSKIADGIEKNKANPSPRANAEGSGDNSFFQDLWNWRKIEEFREIIFESPAAPLAAKLMGTKDPVFYHEHVLDRGSNCQKETIWHHDQPYFPVDGDQNVSLWITVDPVPKDCGMRLVKGSHKWGKWFHPKMFSTQQNYPLTATNNNNNNNNNDEDEDKAVLQPSRQYWNIPTDLDENPKYEILSWDCEPGDCIAFHMRTLHAVRSQQGRRRVLSLRWLGEDCVFAERPWTVPIPLHMYGDLKFGEKLFLNKEAFPTVQEQEQK